MAIIIPSKNIYNTQNQKALKNKIDKVQVEENVFGEQSYQEHNINLNYKLNYSNTFDGFGSSEGYNDVKFTKIPTNINYYISFWFDTDLSNDIFLLRNLKVKISLTGTQYNPNKIDDDQNGIVDDNEINDSYDFTDNYSSESGYVFAKIVSSKEEFDNLGYQGTPRGSYGDIGIQRLDNKRARVYVNISYYSVSGNVVTTYKNANIYIYADRQETSIVSNPISSNPKFTIEKNEIINEKTVYTPFEQSVSSVYISRKSISYLEKIKQLSETYSSNTHWCYFGEEEEKKAGISTTISTNPNHIRFTIYNFYIYTGGKYYPENVLTLGNCVVNYNGKNYIASFYDGGDNNSISVLVPFSDSNGDGIYDVEGVPLSDFRKGEKIFYFGYSENSEETPEEPTNVIKLSEYIIQKTLSKYENGLETTTIRCSVADYFDENGEKLIDIKGRKMSFDIGDEVIPMVYGADGVDRPISRYKDGTDKFFKVVGAKSIYDGAVWQELTLQEKNKKV